MISTSEYVQYGCGFTAPPTWLNFDSSPTLRIERFPLLGRLYTRNARRFPENVRYGDIVKGLPIAPASCRGIYCSHVLEHLAFVDFHAALRHTYDYLQVGGLFRLVVPDLAQLARHYLSEGDTEAAHRFMERSHLGKMTRPRTLPGFFVEWLGNSSHLWMWDEKALRTTLEHAGFRTIRLARFGDSEDGRFREVEERERFEDAVAMQCAK